MVGLEHEYSLRAGGQPLDFRRLIHDISVPGRRLDPGDLNAYRCPSGLVITCDAEEAEVVSPPLPVRPGFAADVAAWAEHGRASLVRLLPPEVTPTPFSTHISAAMPDDIVDAACELFARTFSPAVMLMLGGRDSHGVFIRPRPGRLEVCGEHVMGARLGAAAALVAGGARACAAALVAGGDGRRQLPPLLDIDVRPARGRRGLFVGRHVAFGADLYGAGGRALPLLGGATIPAAEHLVAAWDAACGALGGDAGEADLSAGRALVSGAVPSEPEVAGVTEPSPFGEILERRQRPAFEAAVEASTWDFTVFRLTGAARHAYACVPGVVLGRFLERLDGGVLDDVLLGFLDAAPTGRVLAAHDETRATDLWDDVVIGPDLLPYERIGAEGEVSPTFVTVGLISQVPQTYVRPGKAVVVARPATPLPASPIASVSPAAPATSTPAGARGVPAAPGPSPAEPPPPPAAPAALPPASVRPAVDPPGTRPAERRRRRAGVLIGALLVLVVAGAAAALSGLFADRERTAVQVVSATTSLTPSTGAGTVPSTSTTELTTTTLPPTVSTTALVASTVVTAPALTTRVPVPTTVSVESTVRTTTTVVSTTVTVPPPTQVVVGVASGALGCIFQPSTAAVRQGSTVRFRNDTPGPVSITFTPPTGAGTTISLENGGTSGALPLPAPGSYGVTCNPGGDAVVGRMTVTVTGA